MSLHTSARPQLDDVYRLTKGLAAKNRGAGSRNVPHRLNKQEHQIFDIARSKGFAVMRGNGYRRERKGSPLLNSLRQRADALARPLVWVEQGTEHDKCCIDFSPLRCDDPLKLRPLLELARKAAREFEAQECETGELFDTLDTQLMQSQPIWALPPLTARFSTSRENPKQSKQLAAALVRAVSVPATMIADELT